MCEKCCVSMGTAKLWLGCEDLLLGHQAILRSPLILEALCPPEGRGSEIIILNGDEPKKKIMLD